VPGADLEGVDREERRDAGSPRIAALRTARPTGIRASLAAGTST
jgi:hypothetical protein